MDFSDGSTATTEYSWDKNGNMTRDLNRKISKIGYNNLNLPETITSSDGHKVMNTYDCLGRKVSVIYQVSVPSVTTPQADGAYHHYIKDYQGNNVLTVEETAAGVEGNHWDYNLYYPYGCPTRSIYSDRYMYSGKELDNMNGLRLYDFQARPYDAITTRFLSPDPLRSKYPHISPYAYCANNPILYIDPTGMEIRIIYPEENQNLDYVVYENGVLGPQKGSVIILSEYVNKVRTDLNVLSQIPGEPSLRLSKLQESEQVLEIEKPQNIVIDKSINKAIAEDKIKRNNGEPTGSTIIYDPDSDVAMIKSDNSQKQRPAVVGLAHELLGHGWDYSLGLYLDSNIFKINGVSINEIRAINIENQVREYLKIPKRTSYGGQKIF